MAFVLPRSRLLAWLTQVGEAMPADVRTVLIRNYFTHSTRMVTAALCTTAVSAVAYLRTGDFVFMALFAAEVLLVGVRMILMHRLLRIDALGGEASTDVSIATGLMWPALTGIAIATAVATHDPLLMVMGPVTMMGSIANIVTRNSVAPRLALAQVAVLNLPFDAVLIGMADPWFLLILVQFPLFAMSMKATVWRLHDNYVRVLLAERDSEATATHDALTGLHNRLGLMRKLTSLLDGPRTRRGRLALLFLDLDEFKAVNDVQGHARGDQLLREIARRLRHVVPAKGLIARYGGDEFVLVVPDSGPAEAAALCREAITAVSCPVVLDNGALAQVGLSIGMAWAEPGLGADDLLADADAALYRAKASGKGCFVLAEPVRLAA